MGWEASTPISVLVITTTGAPVTNVVGTTALGNETVIGADVAVTLAGQYFIRHTCTNGYFCVIFNRS